MGVKLLFGLLSMVLLDVVTCARHSKIIAVGNDVSHVDIECNSNNIMVTVTSESDSFNGMIYPKGLSKNSSCLVEYEHAGSQIRYKLPLRSCNTMSHEIADGVEYFNTILVEPHSKLVTSLGRGFNVRCRYQTKSKSADASNVGSAEKLQDIPLPNCGMKIFAGRPSEHIVAEHVKIGDYLSLLINIDEQDVYGLKVTNCIVRDGLSWSEQPLINNDGCPIDQDIMGPFEYSENLTEAFVTYPAHKFPFTSSVYYQCNIKLCLKKSGGCDDVPPVCDKIGQNVVRRRRKRQSDVEDRGSLRDLRLQDEDLRDRSVKVFSGLYVNEVDEEDDSNAQSSLSTHSDDDFCVSTRKFAIGIGIAGILLMLAVILLVTCIVHRRRRRKGSSTNGSSIYSGPYSNHAYSRD